MEPQQAFAVVGYPNDLSSPVDSVWTEELAARNRMEEMPVGLFSKWSVVKFELNRPNQDIN